MKFSCTLEISAPLADAYCISLTNKKFAQANHTPVSNQKLKENIIDKGEREPVTLCGLDGTRRSIVVRKGPLHSNT